MPGAFVKPKSFNRRYVFNMGTSETPSWMEAREGILSRATSVNETTEEYLYMANEGISETEVTGQDVERTFTGHRFFGDPLQDELFDVRFEDIQAREVEFVEWYDNRDGANGKRGRATLSFTDDGSGDAGVRETIGFIMRQNGKAERGTVTWNAETHTPDFTPVSTP